MQQTILGAYAREAVKDAELKELGDGSWSGTVPGLKGVNAFADSRRSCKHELESVIEDWARVLLLHGRVPPRLGNIDFSDPEQRRLALQYS